MATTKIGRRLSALAGIFKEGKLKENIILLWQVLLRNLRDLRIKCFIKHLHGPTTLALKSNDVVIVCLVRDGIDYLPYFFDYHRNLGVVHFAFVDNGSRDGSLEYIKAQPDTTIYYSELSFAYYQMPFKKFLCDKYGWNNWTILLDIDEYFDYPQSDQVSLHELLEYLETYDYTTMVGYMLDMFSKHPLKELDEDPEDLSTKYTLFDLTHVDRNEYTLTFGYTNNRENETIQNLSGGIKKRFFGDVGLITKHPLFHLKPGMACTSNCHDIRNAKVADVTAVLYHYKYTQYYTKMLKRAVTEKRYAPKHEYGGAGGYQVASDILEANPTLSLLTEDSQELHGTRQLVEQGFLISTKQYEKWVKEKVAARSRDSQRKPA